MDGDDGFPITGAAAAGRLLVATPVLGDPNFDRTVIMLLAHGPDGTVGLVLNRPSDLAVVDPLPRWAPLAPDPAVVFVGGPVSPNSMIALATVSPDDPLLPTSSFEPLTAGVGVLDLGTDGDVDGIGVEAVRVFAGYAGWSPGQLDAEVTDGAWYIVDGRPADIMAAVPAGLWRRVLSRQGGLLARAALVPDDPRVN